MPSSARAGNGSCRDPETCCCMYRPVFRHERAGMTEQHRPLRVYVASESAIKVGSTGPLTCDWVSPGSFLDTTLSSGLSSTSLFLSCPPLWLRWRRLGGPSSSCPSRRAAGAAPTSPHLIPGNMPRESHPSLSNQPAGSRSRGRVCNRAGAVGLITACCWCWWCVVVQGCGGGGAAIPVSGAEPAGGV